MNKDFYKVLGVAENASADEIKKAYRKLAKKNHPDVTGGDKAKEARFKEITEANEVLSDEKKRAAYDEQRRNPFARAGAGPRPGPGGGFNVDLGDLFSQFRGGGGARGGRTTTGGGVPFGEGAGSFEDLFNMFGGGQAAAEARAPRKGGDVVASLEIDLPDAALGADKEIIVEGKRLRVKIPAGISDGKTIRLAGQGRPAAGKSAQPGDLLIELHERPHPRFRRVPNTPDVEVEMPMPVDVAILGGKAEVPTLEGTTVTLTIPPGTSSGRRLRLRGKGAVGAGGARGDLYAVAQVQVPTELSPRARELLEEFAKAVKK